MKKPRVPTFEILAPIMERALEKGYAITGLKEKAPTQIVTDDACCCMYGALAVVMGLDLQRVSSLDVRRQIANSLNLDPHLLHTVEWGFERLNCFTEDNEKAYKLGVRLRKHFDV